MSGERWISVRGWRKFQHYDPEKRQPPWIKAYTELMSDDAYLGLSFRLRGILHGIWLEYAASRCALSASPARLGRRLGAPTAHLGRALGADRAHIGPNRGRDVVRSRDLQALKQAGFIDIVASKALAEGYRSRARVETETEKEKEINPKAFTPLRTEEAEPDIDFENLTREMPL